MSMKIFVLFVFSLKSMASLSAQLFESDTPLKLTLNFDYTYVIKDRGERPLAYPAVMNYTDAKGQEQSIKLKIRTRGHSRKQHDVCEFPPLLFKFDDDDVEKTIFEEQRELKLVTHCRNARKYSDLVVKEYLAYLGYSALTEQSFRVRPVEITYQDFRGKERTTRHGFFIEEEKQLRKRLDLKKLDADERDEAAADDLNLARIALYNYYIGNTDWSSREVHNLELFRTKGDDRRMVYVPYDFDWAGLVNAPYAKPQSVYGTKSVTERVVPRECLNEDAVEAALAEMRDRRSLLDELVTQEMSLRNKERQRLTQFLQRFWTEAEQTDFATRFAENCE